MEHLPKYAYKTKKNGTFALDRKKEKILSGIRKLSDEEKNNMQLFHHKNEYDIIYKELNIVAVKAFLASKKTSDKGKLVSHETLRKYHNAICFGAKKSQERLPDEYHLQMKAFLASFKKEKGQEKQRATDLGE